MSEVIVVGSGPNGLTCAAELARQGVAIRVIEARDTIGGGTRSADLTGDGLIHDVCSATHPMAVGSPAYEALRLGEHGLVWRHPEIDLAHPLDGDRAAVMVRSVPETVAGLGRAGPAWRRAFGAVDFTAVGEDMLRPIVHLPKHPLKLARFGIPAALPATVLARSLKSEEARALFGGIAAHAFRPLSRPMSSSVGCALIAACHTYGWAVAEGGSQAIADALAAVIRANGGQVETGRAVHDLDELPAADAVVLDLDPATVVDLAGNRLPARVARAYRRYRRGPGAFKVDFAVAEGVPWTSEAPRRAGTVHVGGTFDEIAAGEREIQRGRMPERPFLLVGQQYLADPTRSNGDVHPVWTYAHVPAGYPGDATEAIIGHIERFAPGFRERIVGQAVMSPADFEAYNSNYGGGDIITGANTMRQILFRPRFTPDPYFTGARGLYICSAATAPGAGAHGMCGFNAAQSVLRRL